MRQAAGHLQAMGTRPVVVTLEWILEKVVLLHAIVVIK